MNLRFAVRVRAGARRTSVGGSRAGQRGDALCVAVTAPAVDGKANDAVRRLLAETFGVRRGDVEIVSGERTRDKLVQIGGAPEGAAAQLDRLLSQSSVT